MNLSFNFSPYYLLLILPLAGLLAWWMYRGTREFLPRSWGMILGAFRFLVLSILAILLLELMLTSQKVIVYPPIVALLQDNSESLLINKDSAYVKEEYKTQLKEFMGDFDPESYSLNLFSFDRELRPGISPDSLDFNQTGTNISKAIEEVGDLYQNQNLGAMVLISDGITTEGSNPLYAISGMKQPVYTVLLGDTTPQRDLRIKNVLFNEIAYLKNEIPVKVMVQSTGFSNADVTVTLSGHGKKLGQQRVKLNSNKQEEEVSFSFKPEEVGLQQYTIRISRKEGELTYLNNTRRIYINVLETQVKIALFAGSPHPDLGALKQAFERDNSYELTQFVLKSRGNFYVNPSNFPLEDFDLIILHNFPQSNADAAMVDKILQEVKNNKKPIMHFIGAFTDLRTISPLYEYMGITPRDFTGRSEEVIPNFLSKYKDHSTYTFAPTWINWANASPPLIRNQSNWQAKQTTELFATAKIKNVELDYPVFGIQNQLGRKNMVFLGENFWRMRAHSFVETEEFENFDGWLFNMVKWLIVNDDKRRFKVIPSKKIFSGGEPVIFRGQAYNDSYNAISGVDIKLQLTNPAGNVDDYFLNESSNGQYFIELNKLEEGTYRYKAEGRKDNIRIGQDQGQFSIGRSNVEHFRLRADRELMQQVALRTGGEFIHARDMGDLAQKLKDLPAMKPVRDYKKERAGLNEFFWPMMLLLLLLSIEWVVRKLYSLL
ncbi:MAG: VWA domain-containing protein [Bacteroidia bacterium]|nr:VWA domain-containing protein [Bacteroidia bacterium]